jgi:uncharacterized protein (UPF0335 family)
MKIKCLTPQQKELAARRGERQAELAAGGDGGGEGAAGAGAGGQLKAFIERIERLEEERKAISGDIKEVYAEAKGSGYDVKVMRKLVAIRRMDRNKWLEETEILELYFSSIGDG